VNGTNSGLCPVAGLSLRVLPEYSYLLTYSLGHLRRTLLRWVLGNHVLSLGMRMNGTNSGLCPVADFGVRCVELSGSSTRVLVM
jgi:hypothetical protein